ncbi:lymphocyte antigen 75 [Engystomops pustulosus]|uniref:lymphocyte antigen 75 n=1 Tax=Engystomops pustulosus TaxID=76066 RepID=UPI003AFADC14
MGAGWVQQLLCLALTVWTAVSGSASPLQEDHTFQILHDQSSKCLTAENDRLSVTSCSPTNNSLWTWGSGHRLFSLGTQKCLGIDISQPQDPLKLVSCDSKLMLWWRCDGLSVSGASGYGLNVNNGTVTASMKTTDTWRRNGKSEAICDVPYHVVYTVDGNSAGKPCEFPFLHKGNWYHDCVYDAEKGQEWCVTSQNFDNKVLVGNCLKPVSGCKGSWTQNSDLEQCYQFNAKSVLKWKEAYMACESQGADLLSISSPEELQYFIENEDLPDAIWIGLNRLESSAGWHWSDNSPLTFINWDEGISEFSLIDGSSCGKLNVNSGRFEIFPCDAVLPYVCKKAANETKAEAVDFWHYSETECPANWTAYNGFCFALNDIKTTWEEAELSCKNDTGSLLSFHSLADIELVVTKFKTAENENIWSGFQSRSFPPFFKWSDGTESHFTYWDQNEPLPPFNVTPNCVSFSGQSGRWNVRNCSETLKSICRKPGKVNNATLSDTGCPQNKDWRKHGEYCYLINTTEVTYEARCSLTITSRFEQEFLNSIIRKQNNIEGKYFWTSLRDVNNTGDYYWETANGARDPTYSNWNTHQPASAKGCVAMATGASLGKWEVKDCKTFKALSICKNRIGGAEEEDTPKPPPTTCPDGWKPGTDLYCYKLFHKERLLRQRTWEEAEGICEEFGGHLVSFSHMQDMNNIYALLKSLLGTNNSNKRWIWLGLNKRNLGNWEWSDGRAISSTVLSDFQEEDYSLRDCAAFEVNLPKRMYWMGIMDLAYPETNYRLKPFHCEAQLDWVCQIPKGTPQKTPDWYQPDWREKMGAAVLIEGSEYWFMSDVKLGYKEAALYCASNGSELATIDSLSAMKSIQETLKKQVSGQVSELHVLIQNWWIKSSDFRGYHPFVLYRVYGSAGRECHSISALSHFPDQFKAVHCNAKLPFICKSQNISLLEMETTKVINSSRSCPQNMTLFGNKCLMKVPARFLSFYNASLYCHSFGGTLPTISDQLEQDYITSLSPDLQQKFWIGLKLALNAYKNTWVDGSEVTYANFHPLLHGRLKKFPYDPFNMEKNQQCVFFLNDPKSTFVGTWDFTPCSEEHYVSICQRDAVNQGPATPTSVPGDVKYKEQNYTFVQKNMTWYEALSECKSKNMELVSITDYYQLSFITATVGQVGQPMWIGLSSRDDGIHYRWQDGSLVTLNRWSEGTQEGDCTFIALDGTWKTESCDSQIPGAVCYVPLKKPADKSPDHVDCPHTIGDTVWIPYRNNCYAFLLTHKRWQSSGSRYACHALDPDAYVLSIRDEDENQFVFNHLQPYTDLAKWVWLGLVYDEKVNSFRWHDETFVQFSNWRDGRPNVTKDNFYAAMRLDGFWDMYPNPKDFQLVYLQQHSIVACKIEKGSEGQYILPMPSVIPYLDSSYFFLKKKLTWTEAVSECKQNDGHLASVHSEHQQLLLERYVRQDGFPVWIGLWNNDGTGMEWSDGSETNYATKHLESKLNLGNCVHLDTKGAWKVKNCSERVDGAICYKNESALQSKLATKDEQCPKTPGSGHWVSHKDFCYGFDVKIYNYSVFNNTEANKICQTVDPTATLLSINDEEENDFVSKYLSSDHYVTQRIWLGVNSTSAGQKSVWLDGSAVQYTNWGSPQKEGTGLCVILSPQTGTWSKVPCAPGYGRVVCKSPLRSSGTGAAVAFAVSLIVVLLIGLLVYLYRRRHTFTSSVRYRRAEDQMESMIDYS